MHMEWQAQTSFASCRRSATCLQFPRNDYGLRITSGLGNLRLHHLATSRHARHVPRRLAAFKARASLSNGKEDSSKDIAVSAQPREGASTDLAVIWARLVKVRMHKLL